MFMLKHHLLQAKAQLCHWLPHISQFASFYMEEEHHWFIYVSDTRVKIKNKTVRVFIEHRIAVPSNIKTLSLSSTEQIEIIRTLQKEDQHLKIALKTCRLPILPFKLSHRENTSM